MKTARPRRAPKNPPDAGIRTRLLRLTIEDLGLIESATVEFSAGLTVFSGETGSGKTMVLGALALVLGERGSVLTVRTDCERARVTLEFQPDERLQERCTALGFALDAGEDGVIVREIRDGGRSNFRLNGRPATAALIRDLFAGVVEYVGQHEQQRLLSPLEHGLLLDRFAGDEVFLLRGKVEAAYADLQRAKRELEDILGEAHRRHDQLAAARECLAHILEVAPLEDEDVRLREQRERLRHHERISEGLRAAHARLSFDEQAATFGIGEAVMSLAAIERFGPEYAEVFRAAQALQSQVSELGSSIAGLLENVPSADLADIDKIIERIESLDRLKRRYGGTLETVSAAAEAAQNLLQLQDTHDARVLLGQQRVAQKTTDLAGLAGELTRRRQAAAAPLEKAVSGEIHQLAMPSARFVVQFEALADVGPTGAERMQFHLAANAGHEPQPLAAAASGGELSRILLALMSVFIETSMLATIVFDEIDAGIGGATALAVSERLARLADHSQVVCVTHLAQIAAHGARHIRVDKAIRKGHTAVGLADLQGADERVTEIARMLSGEKSTVAREHATDLLARFNAAQAL